MQKHCLFVFFFIHWSVLGPFCFHNMYFLRGVKRKHSTCTWEYYFSTLCSSKWAHTLFAYQNFAFQITFNLFLNKNVQDLVIYLFFSLKTTISKWGFFLHPVHQKRSIHLKVRTHNKWKILFSMQGIKKAVLILPIMNYSYSEKAQQNFHNLLTS